MAVNTHGTRGGYVRGCRCELCVQANRDYQRGYLRERVANGITDGSGRRLPVTGDTTK